MKLGINRYFFHPMKMCVSQTQGLYWDLMGNGRGIPTPTEEKASKDAH